MACAASSLADLFTWHPAARLAGDGRVLAGPGTPARLVTDQRPTDALAACFGGHPFRIGGEGPLEAGPGAFETLTGGTTAAPRRIRRTQASWIASFPVDADRYGIGPGVVVGIPGRLSQSLALYGALSGLHLGATVVVDARQAAAAAQVLWVTPTQLRLLSAPMPALRQVVCGGGPVTPATLAHLARVAPQARLTAFYGAAEASFIAAADADMAAEGLAGRAYPGVALRVGAPDGFPGPILVQSPYLFDGYASDPGPATWVGGWLSVGEWGVLQDGVLRLLGRVGRMVTVADRNVWPEAVEDWLIRQPGIAAAAALARPDAARGHVIEAAWQGAGDDRALIRAARLALGAHAAPRRIVWLADWPLLPSGKTDLAAIQRRMGWP